MNSATVTDRTSPDLYKARLLDQLERAKSHAEAVAKQIAWLEGELKRLEEVAI